MPSRDSAYDEKQGYTAPERSKTTPAERATESGARYGSDNEAAAPAAPAAPVTTPGYREGGFGAPTSSPEDFIPAPGTDGGDGEPVLTFKQTIIDPTTGDVIDIFVDEKGNKVEKISRKGTAQADAQTAEADKAAEAKLAADTAAEEKRRAGQSAYDILYNEFSKYGLGSLVEPLKNLIVKGTSSAEFTMELRKTPAYEARFAANKQRVAAGLRALDEADYIGLEDQYQNVMRSYGLPASYWKKDDMGTQEGFTKLLANDVSALELESRVQQASDVLDKGPKEYIDAIKAFYPDVERGDLMAYVLDPKNALTQIQTKIGAAKIGGEYLRAGLGGSIDLANAERLQREGVTAEKARLGAQAIKETAPRGGELAALYKQGPYGITDVEEEVYGLGGATEAKKRREKIGEMEQASFSKRTGNISTALSRNSSY